MKTEHDIRLHTGRTMPAMGIGTWQLSRDTADTIAFALDLGYSMIDTSGDYGTQPGIGEGIKRSGKPRSDFYLVTKVEETDDAYQATRRNLDELALDHADLMLIHRPPRTGAGEALWRGLIRARQEGMTADIGVSNYRTDQIDALIRDTGEVPTVNQIEWSPFGHSPAMLDYANTKGIAIQAYSPLTRGHRLDDETLIGMAGKYGKTPAQLLIRWNIQNKVAPLPKANLRAHAEENFAVFDFEIEADDMGVLDRLNERFSALGSLPYE
ncbi:aldo/keto reductase [Bosea thiooxidans]